MKYVLSAPRLAAIALFVTLSGCGGGGPDADSAIGAPAASPHAVAMGAATPAAAAPVIDAVTVIASDGAGSAHITNQWGGHQARITRHRDGVVRVLYLRPNADSFNAMEWRVMARSASTGAWKVERSGVSSDDVNLLRDPVSDAAYVVAYPNSTPTVYVLPSGAAAAIPGSWAFVGPNSRHYSAAGIGADGTLCFKASLELPSLQRTLNTETHLVCGSYQPATGWRWGAGSVRHIGARHAYDYLFPGGFGRAGQLVATAQRDLEKADAGFPNANPVQSYVFNGLGLYTAASTGGGDLALRALLPPYGTPTPWQATVAPLARMQDSFNDSKHRIIATFYAQPGSRASKPEPGFHTVIANPDGSVLPVIYWSALPQYGAVRIFEDGSKRLWLLWMGQGMTQTHIKLYALQQNVAGQALVLGRGVDFGKPFGEYSMDGAPRLALTSRGQAADHLVEAMFAACEVTYSPDHPFPQSRYPSGNGSQRILYFRIRLPN